MNLSHVERPLVFFHDRCTDGFCAAWLASKAWPDAEFLPVNYGDSKKNPGILERGSGRHVLVVDFSFPREDLLKLREVAASLLVLDHHKSAAQDLDGLNFCVFDMDRSGAGLALDHFFPGVREKCHLSGSLRGLVDRPMGRNLIAQSHVLLSLVVEDRDLWRFARPWTREIHAFLETVPRTVASWDALPFVDDMGTRGSAILAYVDQQVERISEHASLLTWPEGEILEVNSPVLQSEVGNVLAIRAPAPLRTALVWYRDAGGVVRGSLRSVEGGADVSALAKTRGGGGHARAAGFESREIP